MFTLAPDARRHKPCQNGLAVTHLAGSPDGRSLAVAGCAATVEVWNMQTGAPLTTYAGHTDVVTSVTWSPRGRFLASASLDGTVQIWGALSGKHEYTYRRHGQGASLACVKAIAWSPCGRFLAQAASDWNIRVWNVRTSRFIQILSGHRGAVETIGWSPDHCHLVSGGEDGTIRVWDALHVPRPLFSYQAPTFGSICAATWTPSGNAIAFLPPGRRVHVIHVPTCALLWSQPLGYAADLDKGCETDGQAGQTGEIVFTPDGSIVATVGENGIGYLWDARTGSCAAELHTGTRLRTLAFLLDRVSSSLRLISGSWDGTMHAWSLFPQSEGPSL